jgi:hypothetical protein
MTLASVVAENAAAFVNGFTGLITSRSWKMTVDRIHYRDRTLGKHRTRVAYFTQGIGLTTPATITTLNKERDAALASGFSLISADFKEWRRAA